MTHITRASLLVAKFDWTFSRAHIRSGGMCSVGKVVALGWHRNELVAVTDSEANGDV
jgi:hypothetical protein